MQNTKPGKRLFVIPALAVLAALSVLAGCGGDDDIEAAMMPAPMGYRVTVTNNLPDELFAPIVVTHAHNDPLLFDGANYVTREAQTQVLTGDPEEVLARIGDGAVRGHGTMPTPDGHNVLLGPGESVEIMFDGDAAALRILAMVAPTRVPDNYVSAVVNVTGLRMPGDYVTAPLTRFDIGHDEAVPDHHGAIPAHSEMMTHRHREMTALDITQVDADATVGTVKITRR